jgi:branched-chain amino acid transport system ATP-binding protein
MSTAPKLLTHAIDVRFGGIAALSGVSFDLGQGEILGLIGANGAGKSTLINVLSGFQRPNAGTVTLDGRSLVGLPPHKIARAGLARTFQAVRLFADLTVFDNVAAVAAVGAALKTETMHNPAALLELMGLSAQAGRPAGSLPYADQRRLAIARALALAPKFLLLDEPAAGMSSEETSELNQTLRNLRDRTGLGILLVEHNMDVVMTISDRIVVLDVGRVIATGTPAEMRSDPAVRLAYLGAAPGVQDAPA